VAEVTVGVRTVRVRYFAAAAEAAGREEEQVTVEATAGALRSWLADRYGPEMARILDAGSLLVDGTVTRDPSRPLLAAVDVLPPFAGG
jgi:molybdopterin converting factor small subunit